MKLLLRHRRLVVIIHFMMALAMLPGMLLLKNDNSPEVFFARDAGALQRYERFRQEFGGGPAVRVTLTGSRALWTKAGLAWLGKLEEQVASLPGVEAAVGVATLHQWLLLEWPPPDPAAFRARLLEKDPTSLDLNSGFVSPDGETVTLLIVLADMPPPAQGELLRRLDGMLVQAPRGIQAQIFGLPILQRAIDRSLGNIVVHILPLLILLAIVFLTVIFRRLWDVAVTLLFVGVCQSILLGLMGYVGVRLNMVNIILVLLIFVICLATVVHLLTRFRDLEQRGMKAPLAVVTTYRSKGRPVLWTGITTLVAFGSLVTGNTPPVRSLGAWSAVGIALMTVLVFTLYPAMLTVFRSDGDPEKVRPFEAWARRWGRALACWAVRRRTRVLAGSAALIVIALLGVTRLRIEEGLTRYFSPHHPVRAGLERLERHRVGVSAAELILSYREEKSHTEDEEEAGFQNPSAQQRLARLSDRLRREPLVYGAVGSGDLVESAIRSILVEGEVTDSIRWLALGMMQTVPESRKLLHALVTPDGMSARLTLLLPMLNFNQMQRLFRRVAAEATTTFPDAEIWITGQYPLILLAQQTLLRGLIVSLSLTLLCVILVFGLLLRRGRLTWRVMLPNLWPIVLVLGGMGWLQLKLDSVSVMTASIVLGLAVDDTFHTLGHFRRLAPHRGAAAAIEATMERTAPAHILTTVILAAGFVACAFSDFLPVSRMGTFGAVAIIFALIGDLLLIPALLSKTSSTT